MYAVTNKKPAAISKTASTTPATAVSSQELANTRAALNATSGQLADARAELAATAHELGQTREALEQRSGQLDEAGAALGRAQSEAAAERVALAGERARTAELQERASGLARELAAERERAARLGAAAAEAAGRAAELEAALGAEQRARGAAEEDVMRLQQRVRALEADCREGEMQRRRLHAEMQELRGNIRVVCRMRPLLRGEGAAAETCFARDGTALELAFAERRTNVHGESVSGSASFQFDKFFGPSSSQQQVFEEIAHCVQSVLDGYSACVFSYGATGSGKTYTMEGGPGEEQRGMIPRSVELIFQQIQAVARLGWIYRLQGTFVEIYNEQLRDLLAPDGGGGSSIKIVHGKDGTTTLPEARTVAVQGPRDIMEALAAANRARSVGSTCANERSSRSHSVFSLAVRGRNGVTGAESTGVLHLVDLAGSERLAVSRAEGQRLKETQAINKSLAALSDVIAALANGEPHVPYRNSKLTYLLQNALGGASSKTLMLVQISPLAQDVNESLCSLRFASKVNACEIGVARRGQGKINLNS